jgi:hypothetical protein
MPLLSSELLAVAGALIFAAPLAGQQGRELGIQAVATTSDPPLAVAGLYGGIRTSTRTRISATAGAGFSSEDLAFRAEILGHFLLSPSRQRGVGFYLAGGVAAVAGPIDRGYLVLTAGLEDRPGGESGWAAELGVGGGVRVALGYRWRSLRGANIR